MEPPAQWSHHRLLIANRTLNDAAVEAVLRARPAGTRWTVIVPATPLDPADAAFVASEHLPAWRDEAPGVVLARLRLRRAMERMEAMGLDVRAEIGDPDPLRAAASVLHRDPVVEILVAMLPGDRSTWRRNRVAQRLESRHDVLVTTVVAAGTATKASARTRRPVSRGASGR